MPGRRGGWSARGAVGPVSRERHPCHPGRRRRVARYGRDPHYLLQILREVQEACDWISPEAIDRMQEAMRVPRTKIEGVAGFYSFLYTQPRGRYRVLFSDNITDRMLGNMELIDYMCGQLWVERGKISEDGLVSVDTTSCTGMCDQGPAMLVNNRHHAADRSRASTRSAS